MLAFVPAIEVALLTPWLVAVALVVIALRSGTSRRARLWLLVLTGLFALLGVGMLWTAVVAS